MASRLKALAEGRYFFGAVVALFIIQGAWFSLSIKPGLPADETYHTQFITFYAREPLLSGPVISDQGSDVFHLGDLEREPSYFYHYLMSFPQRLIENFKPDLETNTIILRLITLAVSVSSLFLLRALLLRAGSSKALAQLSVAAMSLVGMFLWISSAVNYDALSLFFFLLLLYCGLTFLKEKSLAWLLSTTTVFFLSVVTKYTILPVAVLFVLLVAASLYREGWFGRENQRQFWTQVKPALSRPAIALLVIAFLLSAALVVERPIKNAVAYGQVSPACEKVHSKPECLQSALYKRNTEQKARFEALKAGGGSLDYQPVAFTVQWAKDMYGRLFFYFGHKSFSYTGTQFLSAAALVGLALAAVILWGRRLLGSRAEEILFAVSAFYVVQLLIFNTVYYLNMGAKFGFQGRYLLPAAAFAIYFGLKAVFGAGNSLGKVGGRIAATVAVVVTVCFMLLHFPPFLFAAQSNPEWYGETLKAFNLKLNQTAQTLPESFTADR